MKRNKKCKNIEVIKDADGKNLVIVNDIRFKGRRKINWKEVEKYLKEYIGSHYDVLETADRVYIGTEFPNEFSHSTDTKRLKGANAKAKANVAQAIGELIQIASNKSFARDYNSKHKGKAKKGWYRYDSSFAMPVYSEEEILEGYNVFSVRLLVRHDKNNRKYLYDVLRTKKETSKPLEQ